MGLDTGRVGLQASLNPFHDLLEGFHGVVAVLGMGRLFSGVEFLIIVTALISFALWLLGKLMFLLRRPPPPRGMSLAEKAQWKREMIEQRKLVNVFPHRQLAAWVSVFFLVFLLQGRLELVLLIIFMLWVALRLL